MDILDCNDINERRVRQRAAMKCSIKTQGPPDRIKIHSSACCCGSKSTITDMPQEKALVLRSD